MAKKCCLCKSSINNELEFGELIEKNDIVVHYYCLLLTSNLAQRGEDNSGILGFLTEDINREVKRISRQICFICREKGANVSCCERRCTRHFHVPCGLNKCLFQFIGTFRSFCNRHLKKINNEHDINQECSICLEKIGKFSPLTSIQSACCKTGWFHKICLARFANNAGYFFKCPLCNNDKKFRLDVAKKGIFVPDQDAAWEMEPNAYAELLERPECCEADICKCKKGRKFNSSKIPLIRCKMCGSHCVHQMCCNIYTKTFKCPTCIKVSDEKVKNSVINEIANDEEIDVNNEKASNIADYDNDTSSEISNSSDRYSRDNILERTDNDFNENVSCSSSTSSSSSSQMPGRSLRNLPKINYSNANSKILLHSNRKRKLSTSEESLTIDNSDDHNKRKIYSQFSSSDAHISLSESSKSTFTSSKLSEITSPSYDSSSTLAKSSATSLKFSSEWIEDINDIETNNETSKVCLEDMKLNASPYLSLELQQDILKTTSLLTQSKKINDEKLQPKLESIKDEIIIIDDDTDKSMTQPCLKAHKEQTKKRKRNLFKKKYKPNVSSVEFMQNYFYKSSPYKKNKSTKLENKFGWKTNDFHFDNNIAKERSALSQMQINSYFKSSSSTNNEKN